MILVSGSLGYIGSHLSTMLMTSGIDVFGFDNLSNSNLLIKNTIEKISNESFPFITAGLNDVYLLENIFKKHKITAIIHFAGLKSVGESNKYPGKYYYSNVIGSKFLFSLAKKYNVQNLIFSSSATVYGNPIKLPLDENHPIRATNPYGQNKIDIENLLLNDSYFNNDCSVKILRYFNPIGAHPSGKIGESPKGIPNNLMPFIVKVAKHQYPKVNIFGNDYNTHDGTGVRDYIHIMDLVDGHIKALQFEKKGISIFNLGTGKGYSVLDLIKTFEQTNNVSVPYEIVKRRLGDVATVYANPKKAENLLGFKAMYALDDMCRDVWKFANANN